MIDAGAVAEDADATTVDSGPTEAGPKDASLDAGGPEAAGTCPTPLRRLDAKQGGRGWHRTDIPSSRSPTANDEVTPFLTVHRVGPTPTSVDPRTEAP